MQKPARRMQTTAQGYEAQTFDEQRVVRIGDAVCRRLQQAQLAIKTVQQHHTSIAGHAATVKAAFHDAPSKVSSLISIQEKTARAIRRSAAANRV